MYIRSIALTILCSISLWTLPPKDLVTRLCKQLSTAEKRMADFSVTEYWDKRFTDNAQAFEWLKTPEELLPYIREAAGNTSPGDHQVLHIGPGSSKFSLLLRELVQYPAQIHNVDFSFVAIVVGKELERNAIGMPEQNSGGLAPNLFMGWSCADLMDVSDIRSLLARTKVHGRYTLIIDKSTSDAIACGQPVITNSLDFGKDMVDRSRGKSPDPSEPYQVYPVWLLTLHLALLAKTGALWVVLSYKEERFDFLERPSVVSSLDLKGRDIPTELDPTRYWTVQSKRFLFDGERHVDAVDAQPVYRPVEGKWLFVLQRTQDELDLLE